MLQYICCCCRRMSLSTTMTWIWHTLTKHRAEWNRSVAITHRFVYWWHSFTSFGKDLLLEFASHFRISCSRSSLCLLSSWQRCNYTFLLTLAPSQSELQLCLMQEIHIWVSTVHQSYNGDFIKLGVERIFSPLKKLRSSRENLRRRLCSSAAIS
jgi:hypothetical protein